MPFVSLPVRRYDRGIVHEERLMSTNKILLTLTTLFLATSSFAFGDFLGKQSSPQAREKRVGQFVTAALENYHFRGARLNDDMSKNAFEEYMKRADYGRQFFLQSEVDGLRKKYETKLDDEMNRGKFVIIGEVKEVIGKRLVMLDKYTDEVFKKQFDFTKKETFQIDPEKRNYPRDEAGLKEHWRKLFKQATLTRYLSIKEMQEDPKDEKKKEEKKAKKKKEKKKSEKEMMAEAHEKTKEKYKKFFDRMMDDKREDYLERFVNAVTSVFDPHTVYLPPKKKEDFDIDISGSLEGIGAVLQEDGDYIKVVRIVPGGAAWRQKELEADDVILSVSQGEDPENPVDLVGMRVDDAVRYIRGKKGTTVVLHVKKADKSTKSISIKRDVVEIGASYAKASVLKHTDLNWRVGYIHVPKFYRDFGNEDKNVTKDVANEIKRLKKLKIDALILDLRNNGGGALRDAQDMSGLFIKKGPIVQIKDHKGSIEVLRDDDPSVLYEDPVIVMTNRYSASASEILAGALQDYGRAVVVGGEYSHGKGTVQAVLNLDQGNIMAQLGQPRIGALKVTIQKFYRVNGISTQYKGITPDIVIPDPLAYAENREQDLDYSLKWDKVAPLNYEPWKKYSYDIPLLKKRSEQRVEKNERLKKIEESVAYLRERREDTVVSLNMSEVIAEDKKNEEMVKKFELKDENKKILVTDFEASLRAHEKINKEDEKQWQKDFEQRKKDWVEGLRKDPGLEESLFVIDDILNLKKRKKLTMVP